VINKGGFMERSWKLRPAGITVRDKAGGERIPGYLQYRTSRSNAAQCGIHRPPQSASS
jgi:hypothetical protein